MKKYILKTITTLFIALFMLTSCDLNTSPTTNVEEDVALGKVVNLEKITRGAMRELMETFNSLANPGYGAFLRTSDAMGSDVAMAKRYGFYNQYSFKTLYGSSNGGTSILSWNLSYSVINNMNRVLYAIDSAEGTDEILRERVRAQAMGLRAFVYLHLASSYSFAIDVDPNAVSVPIYTEKNLKSDMTVELQPASSVSEVYTFVIDQLEQALEVMPESYIRNDKGEIDRTVLLGIVARASLYARQWEKAADYSKQLLDINGYLMNENEYKSGFNSAENREWIWGHLQSPTQDDATYQFHFLDVTSPVSYYYSFNADPYFRDLFEDGDYRKSMIYWATDPGKDPATEEFVWMRYAKFKFKSDNTADILLMRTSEIYLINAEANARLNKPEALASLNKLKQARGAQTISISGDELLKAIWLERRKELFGEGFSLVDIIRNQQNVVRKEYPQDPKVAYTYKDKEGVEHTKQYLPMGHTILTLPVTGGENAQFTVNNKYYLYRIPEREERQNTLIYKNYPRPSYYK